LGKRNRPNHFFAEEEDSLNFPPGELHHTMIRLGADRDISGTVSRNAPWVGPAFTPSGIAPTPGTLSKVN